MTSTGGDGARAWVDVDLSALVANARTVMVRSGARLLPMVKANGYGLGAVRVARALDALDPWGFGVATAGEGAELRAAGIGRPIVVFTPLLPGWREACLTADLTPVVGDAAALACWRSTGRPFHVEIDTGMGRAGVRWDDAATLESLRAALRDGAACEGVFTHFHSADAEPATCEQQWQRFRAVVASLPRRPAFVHGANSAAGLLGPAYAGDLVRPGIFLYGGAAGGSLVPAPVAALRALVVAVRRVATGDSVSYGATWTAARATTIATLGIGYADGVLRSLSNRGAAELAGVVCPIVGRVTMDMTMIDTGDAPVAPGDVGTLFGARVTLDAQAVAAGTIAYELLTALGRRVERRYTGDTG
jgi:alanine racemase